MYRLMQPSDEAAVVALWQKERGDSAEFIKTALEKFAGAENIYVAEENDEIVAAALAVPVTLKGRNGSYLYGLCGQGSLLLAGLVDYLCAQQKLRGAGFTVAVPTGQEQAALLENKGFQRAFALRCLPREVSRNLWSQAEFDSVTARKLCELRERFCPDTVQLSPERMAGHAKRCASVGALNACLNQALVASENKSMHSYIRSIMASPSDIIHNRRKARHPPSSAHSSTPPG